MGKSLSSHEIIRLLVGAGWREVRVTGSHHHFRHPSRPGTVTVPHPVKDMPPGTHKRNPKSAKRVTDKLRDKRNAASSGKAA